jgi:hypothetical protein
VAIFRRASLSKFFHFFHLPMKTIYINRHSRVGRNNTFLFNALLALVALLGSISVATAQSDTHVEYFNTYDCFPGTPVSGSRPTNTGTTPTPSNTGTALRSYYGSCHTPQSALRVLVIYAGFTNDNVPPGQMGSSGIPYNDATYSNPWPQLTENVPNPVWGAALPRNAGDAFYTSASSFSSTATDQTLSNFYYQMSQHSASPLKMTAVTFPVRVNVTATTTINRSGSWGQYTQMVFDQIRTNYQPQLQPLLTQGIDKRTNRNNYGYNASHNGYQQDNSTSTADGKIDYTVVIWRFIGSPTGTQDLTSGGGYASVPDGVMLTAPGVTPALSTADGFTMCTGFQGLNKGLFTHEFGHTLYMAPHTSYANGVVGRHFDTTECYGMVGSPMLGCANGWERWYLNWIALQANGVNTDITTAANLPANGLITLRDFISTGDVARIRIPNSLASDGTYQYLWLENHKGSSIWDNHMWDMDGQNPPQPFPAAPRGLLAYVEDTHATRETPMGPAGNNSYYLLETAGGSIRLLPSGGNYDAQPNGASSFLNNHQWGISNNRPSYDFDNRFNNPLGSMNNQAWPRADRNGDRVISYSNYYNGGPGPEGHTQFWTLNGAPQDGFMGTATSYNTVGQKMGLGENPAIFPSQEFNTTTQQLSPTYLNGLTVELVTVASNGDITVRVRFDDTNIIRSTRWTGNVVLNPVPGATYAANLLANVVLNLNTSGTPNRSTALGTTNTRADFVNPTRVTIANGATLHMNDYSRILVRRSTVLYVGDAGSLLADPLARIQVERDGMVSVKTQAEADALRANGQLWLLAGGKLEIRDPNIIITGKQLATPTVDLYPNPGTEINFRVLDTTPATTYRYRVLNSFGQVVRSATFTNAEAENGLRLMGLPSGPYLVEVQDAAGNTRSVKRAEIR